MWHGVGCGDGGWCGTGCGNGVGTVRGAHLLHWRRCRLGGLLRGWLLLVGLLQVWLLGWLLGGRFEEEGRNRPHVVLLRFVAGRWRAQHIAPLGQPQGEHARGIIWHRKAWEEELVWERAGRHKTQAGKGRYGLGGGDGEEAAPLRRRSNM